MALLKLLLEQVQIVSIMEIKMVVTLLQLQVNLLTQDLVVVTLVLPVVLEVASIICMVEMVEKYSLMVAKR